MLFPPAGFRIAVRVVVETRSPLWLFGILGLMADLPHKPVTAARPIGGDHLVHVGSGIGADKDYLYASIKLAPEQGIDCECDATDVKPKEAGFLSSCNDLSEPSDRLVGAGTDLRLQIKILL